jgi:multiple sugar transport system substrate-binding protein
MSGTRIETSRREVLKFSLAGAGALVLAACGGGSGDGGAGKGEIRALFMQQAAYSTEDVKAMTKAFEQQNPGIKVTTDFVAYTALHDKIVTAAPAGTYDVVLIDCIWPAEFASKNIIKDLTHDLSASEREEIFTGALQSAEYKSGYYGIPWILDTEYLFYNKKMLAAAGIGAAPTTWDAVVSAARAMKAKNVVKHPIIWKAAQEEEILCDYGALLGAFGGTWFDDQGNPTFNTGGGVEALKFMRMTIDEGLANPSSLTSTGDDCRKVVSQGNAAMCLNWTYMYALGNDPKESKVAGDIAMVHTPAGPAGSPGINGSMALSVTSTSKSPDAALKYIRYLASQSVQNKYAKLSLPIWKSSYDSSAHLDAPKAVTDVAKAQLGDMLLRPQVPSYNAVSRALQGELQLALSGKKDPQSALDAAVSKAKSIMSNGG